MAESFSHFDESGASRMVDVGNKAATERVAVASGVVKMQASTLRLIRDAGKSGDNLSKGNVLEVARLAGIMAAKQTGILIPLCHPLSLESVTVDFSFLDESTVEIRAAVRVTAKTGVEMEALTAVSVTALTIYDMCKSKDRSMQISDIRLDSKSGGSSGHYERGSAQA